MAVLIANTHLGVKRRGAPTVDAHGFPSGGTYDVMDGPWPGLTKQRGDGGWQINLDDAAWPVREHDLIVEPVTGREFLVITADRLQNTASPVVDHIRCEARLRVSGGTQPGGPQFEGS